MDREGNQESLRVSTLFKKYIRQKKNKGGNWTPIRNLRNEDEDQVKEIPENLSIVFLILRSSVSSKENRNEICKHPKILRFLLRYPLIKSDNWQNFKNLFSLLFWLHSNIKVNSARITE